MEILVLGETVTNILHRWSDILALQRGETVWPSFCDFHTSNICNQRCVGCAYASSLDDKMMSEEDHFRIVDQLHEIGVKAYDFAGGGEPTLLPYLPKLMDRISAIGDNYALLTNGLVMSDELMTALVDGGTYVRFSLEASNREDYYLYKRVNPQQWDIVLENISQLKRLNEKRSGHLEISLKFAVGKSLRGRAHYERIIKLADSLGIKRVTIKALRHQPEELPVHERIAEDNIMREIVYAHHAENMVSHWVAPIDTSTLDRCWLTPLHIVIDHLGDVYVCCYYYNDRYEEMRIGNILRQPLREFWMKENHRMLLRNLRHGKCLEQDCKFQKHTLAVAYAMNRGHIGWL